MTPAQSSGAALTSSSSAGLPGRRPAGPAEPGREPARRLAATRDRPPPKPVAAVPAAAGFRVAAAARGAAQPRQPVGERRAGDVVLGVAAVHVVAGEQRVLAEVLLAARAVAAATAGAPQPGDADSFAELEGATVRGRIVRPVAPRPVPEPHHFADDLMPRDHRLAVRLELALRRCAGRCDRRRRRAPSPALRRDPAAVSGSSTSCSGFSATGRGSARAASPAWSLAAIGSVTTAPVDADAFPQIRTSRRRKRHHASSVKRQRVGAEADERPCPSPTTGPGCGTGRSTTRSSWGTPTGAATRSS